MKTLVALFFSVLLLGGTTDLASFPNWENTNPEITHGSSIRIRTHQDDQFLRVDNRSVKAHGDHSSSHSLILEKIGGSEGEGLRNGDHFLLRSTDHDKYFHSDGAWVLHGGSKAAATTFVAEKPGRDPVIRSGDQIKIRSEEGDKYWSVSEKNVKWHGSRMEAHTFVLIVQ